MTRKRSGATALARFLREVGRNWRTTGAVLPSSPRLARAMTSPLMDHRENREPMRILEVGAGTGAITGEIIRRSRPDDVLVIYEMSEAMIDILENRIKHDPVWKRRSIELRPEPFPRGLGDERYSLAICSLPFNNFPSTLVRTCLQSFEKTLEGGGHLTFFEYCHIRRIKMTVAGAKETLRLRRIDAIVKNYLKAHRIDRETVRLNIPPAWVHTLYFP